MLLNLKKVEYFLREIGERSVKYNEVCEVTCV